MPGVDNVVTDALSRQHDDEATVDEDGAGGKPAIVHTISHLVADVDLDKMAAEQQETPDLGPQNSLSLQLLQLPGCKSRVWCDTSQSRVRFLVPDSWKQKVFQEVHNLSHQSERSTLTIIARAYVWQGMHRDVLFWSRE